MLALYIVLIVSAIGSAVSLFSLAFERGSVARFWLMTVRVRAAIVLTLWGFLAPVRVPSL